MLQNILILLYSTESFSINSTYPYEPNTQLTESICALSFAITAFIFIIYKASS